MGSVTTRPGANANDHMKRALDRERYKLAVRIGEFVVTPRKLAYLKRNWLTAVALLLPAARVLRVFRAVRAIGALRGGARLVGVVSRANRGMRALGRIMGRRGFGYVATLTVLVTVAGAAGMYAYEHGVPGSDMDSYGSALWWTAMLLRHAVEGLSSSGHAP
jgi:voltage-gated potassium channel